ncbi:D-sedoheptulose 7-phosphate isomerase [Desulfonatronovibrio hydrogenovorans]|uniref:D-sedoheptulose 7-phosphate isomerase n=1 Tax=Desulfonatronovibrio hydrogenovorans TaxID=53245 RepID=UPI00048AF331|nr:D-sedoheptulose 7-phosphate isomerase [Desulfonatronovibrio hydrogenovorans]
MPDKGLEIILDHSRQGAAAREKFFAAQAETLVHVAKIASASLVEGGKLMFCGNGGSAADAQHLTAEFVNRFMMERPPLPALALTTDTSVLTSIGNDYSFDRIFSKQVRALGREGDVLFCISTSGNSSNLTRALIRAREMKIITVGFAGKNGGEMKNHCDHLLLVDHKSTPLIQEIQITAGHLLCRLVDYYLFEAVDELKPYL